MSNSKKVIGVLGATGMQGSGLVASILEEGVFACRAFTRDPSKGKGQDLAKAGAEVVACDVNSSESLDKALAGVYGLYVVTAFWEHMDAAREFEDVKRIVEAGEKAGIQHYVWSTLDDTIAFFDALPEKHVRKLDGNYYVPHFDGKAAANSLFPKEKTTFFHTSMYLEDMWAFGMVNKGTLCLNTGDSKIPWISYDDIGRCAYGIFKAGEEYKGQMLYIASDKLTGKETMDVVSEATGKHFQFAPVDFETYKGFGFPGVEEMAQMLEYYKLDESYGDRRDPEFAKKLNPKLKSAKEWAEINKEKLLAVGPE